MFSVNSVVRAWIASLLKAPQFAQMAKNQRDLIIEHVEKSYELFQPFLEQPATIQNILACKIAWLRFLAQMDVPRKSGELLIAAYDLMMPREEAIRVIQKKHRELTSFIEGIRDGLKKFLDKNGITVEQWLASPYGANMSNEAMALYRKGTLTIGKLLEMQSDVIFISVQERK